MAVEHMSGDKITSVPNTSLYRFFILNNLSSRSGRKITKNVAPGNRVSAHEATRDIIDAPRSNRFHPELRYLRIPSPKTLIRASVTKTAEDSSLLILLAYSIGGLLSVTHLRRIGECPSTQQICELTLSGLQSIGTILRTWKFRCQ